MIRLVFFLLLVLSICSFLALCTTLIFSQKKVKWYLWSSSLILALIIGLLLGLNFEVGEKIGLAQKIIELPKRLQVKLLPANISSRNTIAHVSNRVLEAQTIQSRLANSLNYFKLSTLANEKIVYCDTSDNFQQKVYDAKNGILILQPGIHQSHVTNILGNTTVYIPIGATIRLADDVNLHEYSKVSPMGDAAVLRCVGTEEKPIKNIKIILDGKIDGNKENHPYSINADGEGKGGCEGIAFKWVEKSIITGVGTIVNVNGDGIDVDASRLCYFEGIRLINNDGTGFHFGSTRPIRPSERNIAVNLYAEGNGFGALRNGFDLSWPNINGAMYIGCTAENNYCNWEIDADGGIVLAGRSINSGNEMKPDNLFNSSYSQINGKVLAPENFRTPLVSTKNSLSKRQSLRIQTWEKIDFDKELFNSTKNYNNLLKSDFIAPVPGYYFITSAVHFEMKDIYESSQLQIAFKLNNKIA